jgi:dTDP-4-dehydrorhamnose 3,5-epimerase
MHELPTNLTGPVLLAVVHGDDSGFFLESYRRDALPELGVADDFVQENHSRARRGIVRAIHYQPGQAKLVRCVRGEILDVIVDIRRGSPQFGRWEGFRSTTSGTISSTARTALPTGFACCVRSPR